MVSATREEVGPSLGGLFLQGPDFDLRLQRLLQYRPFPCMGISVPADTSTYIGKTAAQNGVVVSK